MFGVWTLILFAAAYLIGAIPFGQIVAKYFGKDLTKSGSGNTGAANAYRSLGIKGGAAVLLADLLKGTLVAMFAHVAILPGAMIPLAKALFGMLAIIGHNYSVFRGFRGGKGIATTFGVVLAMSPKVALMAGLLWIASVALTKYSSVGSLSAVAAMPLLLALEKENFVFIIFSVLAAGFAFFRHRENLERLKQGRELPYDERQV